VETARSAVAVGVIVVRDDDVLFGLRRGAHGAGSWSFPGGHLDGDESAGTCAVRELEEERGLRAMNPRRVGETEDVFSEGLRYRTIFVRVDCAGGEPAVREPEAACRRFWVGEVLCQGTRLCEPCQYLADLTGKPILGPLVHRGGLRGDILRGGVIQIGDQLRRANEDER
jgi:8-oxo-dGTP diphosphatase